MYYIYFQGVRSRSRDMSISLRLTSITKLLRLNNFWLKWCVQNIGKTDINSPGSTYQTERSKERPLQAARNRRQARLNAETEEKR